jgi:hypothetical protein
MELSIIIQEQKYDDVKTYDKTRYNTNNKYITKPDDYDVILSQTFTKNWIDKFRTEYTVINIPLEDWMRDTLNIYLMTGKISELFYDDLEEYIKLNETDFIRDYLKANNIFIRSETVSLKEGIHGIGPYKSLKQIIESICTSVPGHSVLDTRDTNQSVNKKIKLYLIKWIQIIEFQEFRIFVKDNKITAISQQHLYKKNIILNLLEKSEKISTINKWIKIIVEYFEKYIKTKIHLSDFCYDFAIIEDDKPYFIEINPFGAEYSSGSSLYEWTLDKEILYGEKENIYFRYTC